MYAILSVGDSRICRYLLPSTWTREYYNYCVDLLIVALSKADKPFNVILGDIDYNFDNPYKTIKIDIQSEHTLVKLGGRSVDEIIYGNIDTLDGDGKYLVRIPNYDYYLKLDATIEYSLPNMVNMNTNSKFWPYLEKAIYIAPTIYNTIDFQAHERTDTITIGNNSDRRAKFFSSAIDNCLSVPNIENVLHKHDLKQLYDKTKILVNVHQTDHHHTFEELRVLPALCNGVIIISEDVPLKFAIPYADSIVWSSYDKLIETIKHVQDNYEDYRNKIFTSQLKEKLLELRKNNANNMTNFLKSI